jgi:hypothetical protein
MAGMAGWSLAWDDLLARLRAGVEAREKIQQHRVSTERAKKARRCNGLGWWSFKSWLSREERVTRFGLPRRVVAKSGSAAGAG